MAYGVIYADPPWEYSFPGTRTRSPDDYPRMRTKDICNLKPPADDNAVLYLWAIVNKLEDALQVMRAWGFEYKTHAVWDKGITGTGCWFRGQHELLMVGIRGKIRPPEPGARVSSVIRVKRGKHSSKPDQVREMIGRWFPDVPKLEMFAREWTPLWPKPDGWDVWGNEVVCDVAV